MYGIMPTGARRRVTTMVGSGAPRVNRTQRHNLTNLLMLSVPERGTDSFVAITFFGRPGKAGLHTFPACPQGQAPAAGGVPASDIENPCHQIMDIALGKDDSRIRTSHANHTLLRQDWSPGRASPTSGRRWLGTRTACASWLASTPNPTRLCSRPQNGLQLQQCPRRAAYRPLDAPQEERTSPCRSGPNPCW